MIEKNFSLQPYSLENCPSGLVITGTVRRHGNLLALRYELAGPLAAILMPAAADIPARRHGLWQATCCEFFVAQENAGNYWEFNLSPTGDWNVYRFDAYRQGMRAEEAFSCLPFEVSRKKDVVGLKLEVDLAPLLAGDTVLDLGVCAVTRAVEGSVSHWALIHQGKSPDFHRRQSFILKL